MKSYKTDNPEWVTVVDIDALAKEDDISWVWKGSSTLPSRIDIPSLSNNGKRTTRTLLSLSRGGADATYTKEFDMLTETFVTEAEG